MEKISLTNLVDLLQEDFILATMIEFLDIHTLFSKVWLLNRAVKDLLEKENYLLFQKYREYLNVPSTFDASDIPSKRRVTDLFKNLFEVIKNQPVDIHPCAYYTDGGVDTNSNYYFLQNVWKKTGVCYCTVSYSNVHVQSILKEVELPPAENNPMDFLVKPKDKLKIRVPFEKYMTDDSDCFHLLKTFQIHLRSGGYNAYVRSFVVFYSDLEVRNSKFTAMTKRFMKVKTYADIALSKLDVKCYEEDSKTGVEIVEFDVSNLKKIERCMKTKDPGVYPLLWVSIKQKYVTQTFDYEIKQNVAARFISMKLCHSSNANSYSNIDLYNLGMKVIPLSLGNFAHSK